VPGPARPSQCAADALRLTMIPRNLERGLHLPLVGLAGGTLTLASVLLSAAVVIAAIVASVLVSRTIRAVLAAKGVAPGVVFATSKIARYVITLIGMVIAAESLGFNLSAVLTASAVLLVGIGLGLQQIAQNMLAGVILLVERPVRKGDFIKVGEAYGIIRDIGLRATQVITRDEVVVVVPNNELTSSQVFNYSVPTTNVRVSVKVGVAYGSDIALVQRALTTVAAECDRILKAPAPEVRFDDFGDSALSFTLLFWIANPAEDLRVASTVRFAIDQAFRQARIEIPFPQQVVHFPANAPPAASGRT